jgi:hypothetical protein
MVMNNLSGNPRGNLSVGADPAESETARLAARARVMMIISGLTTVLAIAAVVTVIGYRLFSGPVTGPGTDDIVTLPKGARVISVVASAGRVAVTVDVNGATEMRVFDLKTMKQTGRLRFATEP